MNPSAQALEVHILTDEPEELTDSLRIEAVYGRRVRTEHSSEEDIDALNLALRETSHSHRSVDRPLSPAARGCARTARQAHEHREDGACRKGCETRLVETPLGKGPLYALVDRERPFQSILARVGVERTEAIELVIVEEVQPMHARARMLAAPDGR